jgi:hypothetical protein
MPRFLTLIGPSTLFVTGKHRVTSGPMPPALFACCLPDPSNLPRSREAVFRSMGLQKYYCLWGLSIGDPTYCILNDDGADAGVVDFFSTIRIHILFTIPITSPCPAGRCGDHGTAGEIFG